MTGDQVGVDEEVGKKPRPWDKTGWLRSRLKELFYTLLSWPYILAFGMTLLFVRTVLERRSDALVAQVMVAAWTLAFARREWANWLTANAAKKV